MAEALYLSVSFVVVTCYKCGVPIALPQNRHRVLTQEGGDFWCCNGHAQAFSKTETKRLQEQLEQKERQLQWSREAKDRETARANHAERSRNAYRGKLNHVKAHVSKGVCPCCKRSFQNLRRHMATKHPAFGADE